MRTAIAVLSWLCILPALAQTTAAQDARVSAVIQHNGTYPTVSPNGRYLMYSSDSSGALNLYRLDLGTAELLRLTASDCEDSAASWSPDGDKIVFQREDSSGQRDIWEIGADGSAPRNITNTPDISEQHPRYSPDGAAIIFDSNRAEPTGDGLDGSRNYEIYIMSLADGTLSQITDWDRWDMYGSFSPDSNRIAWRRALPGANSGEQNFELFVKDLKSGEETNLSNHPAYDGNPHWSPSGDWIVFISTRDGGANIHVVRPDGTGLRRLTTGSGRALAFARPSFTPSGAIVANRSVDGVTDIVVLEFP